MNVQLILSDKAPTETTPQSIATQRTDGIAIPITPGHATLAKQVASHNANSAKAATAQMRQCDLAPNTYDQTIGISGA